MMQVSFALLIIATCFYNIHAYVNPTTALINGRHETVVPIVTVTEKPRCVFQGRMAACCLTVSVPSKSENVDTCIKVELDTQNRPIASLIVQDNVLIRREVRAGEVCYPIQTTPLTACLNIYYINVDPQLNSADACFFVNVNRLMYLDFKCIKYNNGRFEQNSDHTAESEGLYQNLNANGQQYFSN